MVYQDSVSDCASYGLIQFFASVSNRVFVFVSQFKVLHVSCQSHFGLSHDSLDKLSVSRIIPIESNSGELVCIPASQLQAKCIFVSIANSSSSSSQYVVTFSIICCMITHTRVKLHGHFSAISFNIMGLGRQQRVHRYH